VTVTSAIISPFADVKLNFNSRLGHLFVGAFPGRFQFAFDPDDWPATEVAFTSRRGDRSDINWDWLFRASRDVHGAYHLSIPYWLTLAISAPLILPSWTAHRRRAKRSKLGLCPTCGYDLRAAPDRCPECGSLATESQRAQRKNEI